jgi:hypothetical protein
LLKKINFDWVQNTRGYVRDKREGYFNDIISNSKFPFDCVITSPYKKKEENIIKKDLICDKIKISGDEQPSNFPLETIAVI